MPTENTGTEEGTSDFTVEDFDLIASLDVGDDEGTDDTGDKGDDDEAAAAAGDEGSEDEGKGEGEGESKKPSPKSTKKASADTGDEEPPWFDSIKDAELRELAGEFGSRDEMLETFSEMQKLLGIEPMKDWRQSITDKQLREHADRYTSLSDVVKSSLDLRQQLGRSLVLPEKGATKEEREAFAGKLNKMLGVPDDPSGYEFPKPPEGVELTDGEKAAQEQWATYFHEMRLPKSMADSLVAKFAEETVKGQKLVEEEDKKFAEATEAELKGEWGDDFEPNRTLAVRTARNLFGDDFDTLMETTMSNGRLLMDSPIMLRPLARVGKEMSEGGPALMTDSERETIDDQVKDLRKRADEAKNKGETRLANKLYADEQALVAKIVGRNPIVGDATRSV